VGRAAHDLPGGGGKGLDLGLVVGRRRREGVGDTCASNALGLDDRSSSVLGKMAALGAGRMEPRAKNSCPPPVICCTPKPPLWIPAPTPA
jgi:hypothetical protein